jgi:hypothetical protein
VRRVAVFLAVALALAGCGGDDDDDLGDGVPDRTAPVPADVRAFLDDVADPAALPLTATYHLLTKAGGAEHTVEVRIAPPTVEVAIDGTAIDLDDEATLSSFGIFSGFLAANPAAAIESAARRAYAGDAVHTTRQLAGVELRCLSIPVQGAQTSEACLTPDGVFGYVDNPSATYELTAYDLA